MKKEYKQTPIGKIPKDWKVVELGEIFTIRTGGDIYKLNFSKQKSEKYKFPIYSNSLENKGLYGYASNYQYPENCITVTGRGTLGYAIPRFEKFNAIIRLLVLIPKTEVDIIFISEYINAKINFKLEKTSIPQLTTPKLAKYKILLPPLPEQKAIAKILSTVDEAIQKVDESIAKTERLKKGSMQKLLTKGIGHKEFKDTEIGRIPKKWGIKKLEEVSTEVTIGVVNPATPYYTTPDKGVPYFRSQNVRENKLEPTDIYVEKEFNKKHHKSILKENDVLTVQTGFIGTSCLVPKIYEGSNCHSLLITRTNPKMLNPEFLCYILNSATGKNIIKRHNSGWGRNHLLLRDFRKIKIPLPPLPEQQKIAEILSTVDKKLELERRRKEKLERIKKGLMNDLLTGKKRVNVEKVLEEIK